PDALLGRVNSVYRFFGWGMMSVGALAGGALVSASESLLGREWALRLPFLIAGAIHAVAFLYALPRLNSARIAAVEEAAGRAGASDGRRRQPGPSPRRRPPPPPEPAAGPSRRRPPWRVGRPPARRDPSRCPTATSPRRAPPRRRPRTRPASPPAAAAGPIPTPRRPGPGAASPPAPPPAA